MAMNYFIRMKKKLKNTIIFLVKWTLEKGMYEDFVASQTPETPLQCIYPWPNVSITVYDALIWEVWAVV